MDNQTPVASALDRINAADYRFDPSELSEFKTDYETWVQSQEEPAAEQAYDRMKQLLLEKGCPRTQIERLLGMPVRQVELNSMKDF